MSISIRPEATPHALRVGIVSSVSGDAKVLVTTTEGARFGRLQGYISYISAWDVKC
jgi:hypothetical protein